MVQSDVGGVEHDTDAGTESVRGHVMPEFCLDNTGVAVWARHAAPDHPDLRT